MSDPKLDELAHPPEMPTEVGTIRFKEPKLGVFKSASGETVEVTDGPPPWEISPFQGGDETDARQFVKCPDHWILRWLNPRVLESRGWRWWQPVMASHPEVTVLVPQMRDVGNNIRRGGQGGDVLAYMPREWYDKLLARKDARNARRTQSAVDKFEHTRDALRGTRYIKGITGRHPTHTIADGKTIPKD